MPIPELSQFTYGDYGFDAQTGTLYFRYQLGPHHFEEVFSLPAGEPYDKQGFENILSLCHLAIGLSYYKLSAAPEIVITKPVTAGAIEMLRNLLHLGMAEFAYRNGLELLQPQINAEVIDPSPSTTVLSEQPLVPIGGGKDSAVTIDAVSRVSNAVTGFAIRNFTPIIATAERAAVPLIVVGRTIDPLVRQLQDEGGMKGHVPATAVVSLIACAVALHQGANTVIMSNERSASEGNVEIDGISINHQYSKSFHFEQILHRLLTTDINPNLEWFSLLRPFSELAIAKRFAELTHFHDVFLSCNKAFVLDAEARATTWCGECPKCVFVYLILANFIDRDRLNEIFGTACLDNPDNRHVVEELCGLTGEKPFECVGEHRECRASIKSLSQDVQWGNDYVVKALSARLEIRNAADLASLLVRSDEHLIPEKWKVAVDAVG